MAKRKTTAASDIEDDAEYSVSLKRPIKLGRSNSWARPGTDVTLKGLRLKEHLEDVDGYEKIAS